MKDFNCEMLDLSFGLSSPEEIDQDAFLKAIGVENKEEQIDEDGDMVFPLNIGAREKATDYHVHLRAIFYKDGKSRFDLNYHESRAETVDESPPYAENTAQWLGGFIKTDKVAARLGAEYTFDKFYSPIIALPFPLVTPEKAVAGALVTGISLVLPKEESSESVIIQSSGDETHIFLSSMTNISLKDFELFTELERLATSVNSLMRKREAIDGDTQKNNK